MTSEPLSFEAAFASLEESVAILEQGQQPDGKLATLINDAFGSA